MPVGGKFRFKGGGSLLDGKVKKKKKKKSAGEKDPKHDLAKGEIEDQQELDPNAKKSKDKAKLTMEQKLDVRCAKKADRYCK